MATIWLLFERLQSGWIDDEGDTSFEDDDANTSFTDDVGVVG